MADALATLEPGYNGAFVAVLTTEGAKLAIVDRINETWSVSAYAAGKWEGPLEAGVEILAKWR